jgi:hypothetical protein
MGYRDYLANSSLEARALFAYSVKGEKGGDVRRQALGFGD